MGLTRNFPSTLSLRLDRKMEYFRWNEKTRKPESQPHFLMDGNGETPMVLYNDLESANWNQQVQDGCVLDRGCKDRTLTFNYVGKYYSRSLFLSTNMTTKRCHDEWISCMFSMEEKPVSFVRCSLKDFFGFFGPTNLVFLDLIWPYHMFWSGLVDEIKECKSDLCVDDFFVRWFLISSFNSAFGILDVCHTVDGRTPAPPGMYETL